MQIKLMLLLLALSKPQANLKVDGAKLKKWLVLQSMLNILDFYRDIPETSKSYLKQCNGQGRGFSIQIIP